MIRNKLYLSLVIVASFCLAGYTGNAQRSSSVKQTWEYKVILIGRVTDPLKDPQYLTDYVRLNLINITRSGVVVRDVSKGIP